MTNAELRAFILQAMTGIGIFLLACMAVGGVVGLIAAVALKVISWL